VAQEHTKGAWYRRWRLVSLDGSTLDVADTAENREAFGKPGASRGRSAFPQIRLVTLVENGTHVFFGRTWPDIGPERFPWRTKWSRPSARYACLADRNFLGYALWQKARATGADLLWRGKTRLRLPCDQRLEDGSYLSRIYPSERDRRKNTRAEVVRVIDYQLEGVPDAEPFYRAVTSISGPQEAPAEELAGLYPDRWKSRAAGRTQDALRGARIVLRSKTPELVRQEFYGFMMAHFAIRGLMHEPP